MTAQINLPIAFAAGLASFFSPCVLPLVPAYLSFITGLSINELTAGEDRLKNLGRISSDILLFVCGFSFIFIALGASATYLGSFLASHHRILKVCGGIIIILFGLHIGGLVNILPLQYERRLHLKSRPANILGSFTVGAVFALGWTPCLGPILASILTMASLQPTLSQGILLLSVYSLGLAVPFILAGFAVSSFLAFFRRISRYLGLVSKVCAAVLIATGIVIIIA